MFKYCILSPRISPLYLDQNIVSRTFVIMRLFISEKLLMAQFVPSGFLFTCPHVAFCFVLCLLEGTTSAYNCEMTSCLEGCPAPLSHSPSWAPTLSSQSLETMTRTNVGMITLASSASHQTTRKNWKIKSLSCTRATG